MIADAYPLHHCSDVDVDAGVHSPDDHGCCGGNGGRWRDRLMNRPPTTWALGACGAWLIALGFYFMVMRPALLPEDLRYMGTTLADVRTTMPGLESWLAKVFTVLGGFMAGAGVLTVFIAVVVTPSRLHGTALAIGLSGLLTVGLMSAVNFGLQSDFRWFLVFPALVWLAGIGLYSAGRWWS